MFVDWSEEDQVYLGYCPDLFGVDAVCHDTNRLEAWAKLRKSVADTLKTADEQKIPMPLLIAFVYSPS